MEEGLRWHQKLRRERELRGWTQNDVAKKIACDNKNVGRWERGEVFPSPYYRQKLMKIFDKSAEALGLLDSANIEPTSQQSSQDADQIIQLIRQQEDWGTAPGIEGFCGREQELAVVEHWITIDHCRIIAVLGIGGMGKTTFITKVAKDVYKTFDCTYWRSLQYAPSLETLVKNCLLSIAHPGPVLLPENEESMIAMFIDALQQRRCLLIFDNIEAIFHGGQRTGVYQEGYEGYGRLFKRIGEMDHRSCLLLTSREKPGEIAYMEGKKTSPVRSLLLSGLKPEDGKQLLQDRNLSGSSEAWSKLVQLYGGNPLALKIASESIQNVFHGDITAFMHGNEIVVGDISELLDQQFHRLSPLEQNVMYWLAIEREALSLAGLQKGTTDSIASSKLLDTCDSLYRRCLIEAQGDCFTLQPVIMEYVTGRFVEQIGKEIAEERLELFGSHALLKAESDDYVRESQRLSFLMPIAEHLLNVYGKVQTGRKLKNILAGLQVLQPGKFSYAVGNILNLLIYLQVDLRDYNFSHLIVRQAYLQGAHLQDTNFTGSTITASVFTETFTSILCIAVSPDGALLAVGTTTGEILLRQADSLTPLFTCLGHADGIRSLSFSPDGSILASGSEDQTIRLWSPRTGRCLKVIAGHEGYVRSVAFSPNGKILASGSDDQTIQLWEAQTGRCIHILRGHTDWVRSVAFSPDGKLLASGGEDRTIRLWDTNTGNCVNSLHGHESYVLSVAFSSDGKLLASGSNDQNIRLWQSSTGQCQAILRAHTDRIRGLCFHPGAYMLASGSDDQTIRLWDTDSGQCFRAWHAHSSRIWSLAFFPKGELLVSVSEDETIRYWQIPGAQCQRTLRGYTDLIKSVAFHPDGQLIASGSEDQTIQLWEAKTGQCLKTLRGHTHRVRAVTFSPDRSTVASGSEDETVRIWDIATGECMHILHGHTHLVRAVAFNADGSILASGSHDQTIRLWEASTGRCLKVLESKGRKLWAVTFCFDDRFLITGSEDGVVRVLDSNTGECIRELTGHTYRVWAVSSSPHSPIVASCSDDQTIRLWNANSGKLLSTLVGHTHWVRAVAVGPDGLFLASGSYDQTIRIWDINSGTCLKILRGHSKGIWSVAFSDDGSLVASGSDDGTTKLWDIKAGTCIKTLRNDRPYERMNITDVTGLTEGQKVTLKALGATEHSKPR